MFAPTELLRASSAAASGLLDVSAARKRRQADEQAATDGGGLDTVEDDERPFVPPAIDLPTVDLGDGKKTSVREIMLESIGGSSALITTRVDVQDVSLRVVLDAAPSSKLLGALFNRHPPQPVERSILDSITFALLPGETTLLLGGPRSGKSSLLDVIAGRRVEGVNGEITLNGVPPTEDYQRQVSYVLQGDEHAALLTVRETLEFAARCQMPTDDEQLIQRRVDAVLQLLGLAHTQNTIVGDWANRGVSGGERRRCSIGIEWVKGPRFFLLDEPTTGLDSGASLNIGRCLRAIGSGLRTPILCALLQPSWELVCMFDKILMIAEGQIAYWGPVQDALKYFASLGFSPPLNYSASEFISELVDHPEKFQQDVEVAAMRIARTSDFVKAWRESPMRERMMQQYFSPINDSPTASSALPPLMLSRQQNTGNNVSHYSLHERRHTREVYPRSPLRQFVLLMRRGVVLLQRDRVKLLQQALANAFLGLIMGLLFFRLDSSQADSRAMFGLIFFMVARMSFDSLATMSTVFLSRGYFARQRAARYYQMLPYAASSLLLEFPFRFSEVFVFLTEVYWLAGLRAAPGNYFFALLVLSLQSCSIMTLSRAIASASSDPLSASLTASTVIVILMLYSGFLITRLRMPKAYLWMHYISPLKYASDALSTNEFAGRTLFCKPSETYPPASDPLLSLPYPQGFENSSVCAITTGDELLHTRGITVHTSTKWLEVSVIVMFFLAFCVAFYVAVRLFKWPTNMARGPSGPPPPPPPPSQRTANAPTQTTSAKPNPHSATLSWRSLEYAVPDPIGGGRKTLLKDINGFVKPRMLVALMGASGAGKTTLLDVLAARKNVGEIRGEILLDGNPIGVSYPRVIGYVEQFDMHYALQTVQEAFQFAARARLPARLPPHEREEIVRNIVALLEMDSLRQRLVATLNPEEQKRLAMGVELVSQPAVLFLDEPTSGLDSNAADRVMSAIQKVASSGTSVVCTIHQPSTRIFFRATHLLLLRRGGQVLYFGELGHNASTLLQYFRRFGLAPPPGMNPADFVLEVSLGKNNDYRLDRPRTASPAITVSSPSNISVTMPSPPSTDGVEMEPINNNNNTSSIAAATNTQASTVPLSSPAPVDEVALNDLAAAWNNAAESRVVVQELQQSTSQQSSVSDVHAETNGGDNYAALYTASLKREYALSWFSQFHLLMGRWGRALGRMPGMFVVSVVRATIVGFLIGSTFFRRPHDQQGASELIAAIFFAAIYSFLTAFAYIPAFFIQRAIFYRERAERMYRASSWGVSRAVMDLPGIIVGNFIVAVLVYWLAGLRSSAGAFFWFLLTVQVFGCVALMFAQMLSATFAAMDIAGLVFSSIFASFALASGFLIPRPQIRVWMRWLYWMSFNRYYLESLAVNELKADTFDCNDLGGAAGYPVPIVLSNSSIVFKPFCPFTTGREFLQSLGAYPALQYYDTLVLVGFWAGMMMLFLCSLRFFVHMKR